MASYMNIYLIESETKNKKFLTFYTGSSEFYQILNDETPIPQGEWLDNGVISKTSQYLELSIPILKECVEKANTYIRNYKDVQAKSREAKKDSRDMFIEYISRKNLSLEEAKEAILDFSYDTDEEDKEFLEELEDAKRDFEFLLSLLYKFGNDDDFSGIAVNIG